MKALLITLLLCLPTFIFTQEIDQKIQQVNKQIEKNKQAQKELEETLENLKLYKIIQDLKAIGLPSNNYIEHSAMALEYAEKHEQAKWVAHIILPDIITGTQLRSNDFRPDPKIKTGTAIEKDYFLKYEGADGKTEYDGFGYDRGHLAPSADFRWSAKALSESYYYSNMSPQLPEFNREGWADLEGTLRSYIFRNPDTQLYIVTGGILKDSLDVIERSINKPSIPEQYFKVALDLKNKRAIGFIIPNQEIEYPLISYAVPVDEVENISGLDFFNGLDESLENRLEASIDQRVWFPEENTGNVPPIFAPSLPKGHFNTVQARRHMGSNKEVTVCGTDVSSRYSRSGNLWLNIDRQFPNQIFSVYIAKKDLVNFDYQADKMLENQKVCFEGKIQEINSTPTIKLRKEEKVRKYDD